MSSKMPESFEEMSEPSRREVLRVMGASLALAGVTELVGCNDKPHDAKIVPWVNAPEAVIPGKPLFFATAMPFNGYGRGVLVANREGRPIKIEGNPDHPSSLGGSDAFMQASILDLYDPDRATLVTRGGVPTNWGEFWQTLREYLDPLRDKGGEGLRILSGICTSPTLDAQRRELLARYPKARWHTFDPLHRHNINQGTTRAFDRRLSVRYDFAKAKVILSLDSDFLIDEPGSPAYARQFADGRRVRREHKETNRLYVAESTLSITGSMADHRLALPPGQITQLAGQIASQIGVNVATSTGPHVAWARSVGEDLTRNSGACVVIAGESQPPEVHALAHAMNHALGNFGKTVFFSDPVEPVQMDDSHSLAQLVSDMRAGSVKVLLILGENPVYTAPADVELQDALSALSSAADEQGNFKNFTAHLALHEDETSFYCQWHLPQSHYLEMWGDVRGHDGTISLIQPLMTPLYSTLSIHEFLESTLGRPDRSGYEIVQQHWRSQGVSGNDFDGWWQEQLKRGVIEGTASPAVDVKAPTAPTALPTSSSQGYQVVFRPDYTVWDGRFTNNAWMQELPKPFTKLTWDNAVLMSPATASALGVGDQDVVNLAVAKHEVQGAVLLLPGLPDHVLTVHLGYGRTHGGNVSIFTDEFGQPKSRGFNAYALRTSAALWHADGLQIARTGKQWKLVTTRSHHAMEDLNNFSGHIGHKILQPHAVVTLQTPEDDREISNRRIVRLGTIDEFRGNENFVKELGGEKEKKPLLTLYPPPGKGDWDYSKGYQWGMSIDMTTCIGCNACVVACQAENNIPVVGKDQVDRQREMHWIRIDSYFSGDKNDPTITHQPVPCMHCENAPCEYVCPTGATTHSAEGLNQMTYNRCVGTRYCSNNCPYKVRRFNFLAFTDAETTQQRMLQRNPDVTVRGKGIMEKCSYCIQRIQNTRIDVEKMLVELNERARTTSDEAERTKILAEARKKEFELVSRLETACQQACPTRAIVFGSINDVAGQKMEVAKLKQEPLDYSLLRELTTRPRTTYLARISNPNEALSRQAATPSPGNPGEGRGEGSAQGGLA